ncbi:ABC transporter ATP-binding protein, partial [Staphylococcus cohnii]
LVASQIIEITSQKTTMYEGNYENYEQIKAIEQQSQVKAFEKAQKEINDLKSSMDQVQRWHASAKAKASVRNPYEQKKLSKLMKRAKAKETQLTHKINEQDIVNPNQHDVTQYQFQETDTFQNKYLL